MNHSQLTDKELIRHLASTDDALVLDLVNRLEALQDYSCDCCENLTDEVNGLEEELRESKEEIEDLNDELESVAIALNEVDPSNEALQSEAVKALI